MMFLRGFCVCTRVTLPAPSHLHIGTALLLWYEQAMAPEHPAVKSLSHGLMALRGQALDPTMVSRRWVILVGGPLGCALGRWSLGWHCGVPG